MKKKQGISQSKLFAISFLVTAIILTVLFGLYHRFLLKEDIGADLTLPGVTVPVYSSEDNFDLLVIYDEDLSGNELFAAAVCMNAVKEQITVCSIDLRSEVFSLEHRGSLAEKYRLRGTKGLRAGVESLLQKKFDAAVRCDKAALRETVSALGGVTLQAGDRENLDQPAKAGAYAFAKQFSDGENRALLFFRLVQGFLADSETAQKGKSSIFRHCDTDLSAYQILLHQDALRHLMAKEPFVLLELSTQQVGQGEQVRFLPEHEGVTALQQAMG